MVERAVALRQHYGLVALAGILVLASIVRAAGLESLPFVQDELYTLRDAGQPAQLNGRPLYFALQRVVLRVAEPSPLSLRALPFAFGLLGVWATWLVGRRAFGVAAGLVAALFVAISPWHIFASQMARYWSLVYLLAALTLYALLRAREHDRALDYLSVYVLTMLGILVHPTFLLPFAGVFLGLLLIVGADGGWSWRWPSKRGWRWLWAPLLVTLIGGYVALVLTGNQGILRNQFGRGIAATLRGVLAMVESIGPGTCAAAAAVAVAMAVGVTRRTDRAWGAAVILGCASTVSLFLLAGSFMDVYAIYGTAMLPLVLITVAGGIQRVGDALPSAARTFWLPAAAAIGLAAVAPSTLSHLSDGTRFDYRPAYQFIQRTGTDKLVVGTPRAIQAYYAPELRLRDLFSVDLPDLDALLIETDGFWMVTSHRRYGIVFGPAGLAEWIQAHCRRRLRTEGRRFDYRQYRVELHWCAPTSRVPARSVSRGEP